MTSRRSSMGFLLIFSRAKSKIFQCDQKICWSCSSLFKVLVILQRSPGPSPAKAPLSEVLVSHILPRNFVGERCLTVDIWQPISRLDASPSSDGTHTRIIKRIYIYRKSKRMFREFCLPLYPSIAEAAGVVGLHRVFVVCPKNINEPHAPDGVSLVVELTEDKEQVVGYRLVANHFTQPYSAVEIIVEHLEVSKVGALYVTV